MTANISQYIETFPQEASRYAVLDSSLRPGKRIASVACSPCHKKKRKTNSPVAFFFPFSASPYLKSHRSRLIVRLKAMLVRLVTATNREVALNIAYLPQTPAGCHALSPDDFAMLHQHGYIKDAEEMPEVISMTLPRVGAVVGIVLLFPLHSLYILMF